MSTAASKTSTNSKNSLREFQQRLATRLSQSKSTQVATHLAVEVGKRRLLLPLAEAGEISSTINLQPLPHAKAWFMGVTVSRGQILGVADLAVLLGEAKQSTANGTYVALGEALENNCMLRVDRLAGLRTLDQYSTDEKTPRGDLGMRYFDNKNQVWEELSLGALARDEQFLHIFL